MKYPILILAIAAITLTGCSNSIEGYAKKTADLTCKTQKLTQKVLAGDASAIEENSKLAAELITVADEMKDKYKTEEDQKKFDEAFLKAMADCK